MKALIYTLLLVVGTQALVPKVVHDEHGQTAPAKQIADGTAQTDTPDDDGVKHCNQCHGSSVAPDVTTEYVPPPAARLSSLQPASPQAPDDPLLRPPIT